MAKQLKYNIEKLIRQLPRSITLDDLLKSLIKQGVSERTFYRDRKIQKNDAKFIPSDRLDIYAGIFGVTADELKNYIIPKIKPITEESIRKSIKTGLS